MKSVKPLFRSEQLPQLSPAMTSEQDHLAFKELAERVHRWSGINVKTGKEFLIETRLSRRIQELGLQNLLEYITFLDQNADEQKRCVELLTTHKTEWFREIVHYQWLKKNLNQIQTPGKPIRIWSAACSAGPELASVLFLLLKEGFDPKNIRLLGSDISRPVLERARSIRESSEYQEQLSYLQTHFSLSSNRNLNELIEESFRNSIKWREFNLISSDLPIGVEFDVIFLRNVLIYFDRSTVEKVCRRLCRYLRPGGFLITGLSESLFNDIPELKSIGQSIYQYSGARSELTLSSNVKTLSSQNEKSGRKRSRTRILIVEDSKPIQKILQKVYSEIPGTEIIGVAPSISEAERIYQSEKPDFISLDMKLEGGSGLDFLRRIQIKNDSGKVRCVLITDLSMNEGSEVLDALELGATSYIQKPQAQHLDEFSSELGTLLKNLFDLSGDEEKIEAEAPRAKLQSEMGQLNARDFELILVGSSTGGTEVVRDLIWGLPKEAPPIVIVQHMPQQFTTLFAQRLTQQTGRPTHEVTEPMEMKRGHAYLATGGRHAVVEQRSGSKLWVRPIDGEPINRFKPSVSMLFESASSLNAVSQSIAIMLTGMGRDGADEMLKLKKLGALTLGQSKESCVVYGMPRAAEEQGAIQWSGSPREMIELWKEHRFHLIPKKS